MAEGYTSTRGIGSCHTVAQIFRKRAVVSNIIHYDTTVKFSNLVVRKSRGATKKHMRNFPLSESLFLYVFNLCTKNCSRRHRLYHSAQELTAGTACYSSRCLTRALHYSLENKHVAVRISYLFLSAAHFACSTLPST